MNRKLTALICLASMGLMIFSGTTALGAEEGIGETGTDSRDIAPKFTMTYEIPLAYERDVRSTDTFKNGRPGWYWW